MFLEKRPELCWGDLWVETSWDPEEMEGVVAGRGGTGGGVWCGARAGTGLVGTGRGWGILVWEIGVEGEGAGCGRASTQVPQSLYLPPYVVLGGFHFRWSTRRKAG
jgi:hypothetical protein